MDSGDAPTLVVQGLCKSFGDIQAVQDVSFTIAPGETFGLLGPNGAGKTTAISMICGLLDPDAGSVTVCDTPIRIGSTKGRRHIGYVPQELAIYPDMSGRDNLRFFARLYGIRGAAAKTRIDAVLDVVGLADRADHMAKEYSGGMQRRLNIAAGMLHEPSLLILDEPTVGIDPQSRNAILQAVADLGDEGMSVLYTTHYMEEAERLCRRVSIMDHGVILATGTRRELIATVGEHDTVGITIVGDPAAASTALVGAPGVAEASHTADGRIDVVVDAASARLPDLLQRIAAIGVTTQEVEVREPSLDTVFLHVTGTALRD